MIAATELQQPRERPILFKGEMVRAILAGRKTQTRRVAKFVARDGANLGFSGLSPGHYCTGAPSTGHVLYSRGGGGVWQQRTERLHCPYGAPGDRLWVKETWGDGSGFYPHTPVIYQADPGWSTHPGRACQQDAETDGSMGRPHQPLEGCACNFKWRPSIFMPRGASRITLEVTEVRVQRLQEITEEDARAEGVGAGPPIPGPEWWPGTRDPQVWWNGRDSFRLLWERINGADSWAANPWVWALTFRRLP